MPSNGMHCSSIKKFVSVLKPAPSDQNLRCINFLELFANKSYFLSETTVIFFLKKLQKMCILALLKSNRKMNQVCEKLYIK